MRCVTCVVLDRFADSKIQFQKWHSYLICSDSLPLWVVCLWTCCILCRQTKWLYLTVDPAVVQLNTEQCHLYSKCIDCIRDPHCGWNTATRRCQQYQPGYDEICCAKYSHWYFCMLSRTRVLSLRAVCMDITFSQLSPS